MAETFLIRNRSRDPAFNLALEEDLLSMGPAGDIFMVWQNAPSVIIGKNQFPWEEADLSYAEKKGIPVIRRKTGGGAVYHDEGNVNYTVITDTVPGVPADLKKLSSPVVRLLRGLGLNASFSGKNDITVDGLKVSGTAYRIDGGRILAHGCVCVSTDLDVMSKVLTPPPDKLRRHGIASVRSRVAALTDFLPGITAAEFAGLLEEELLRGRDVSVIETDSLRWRPRRLP